MMIYHYGDFDIDPVDFSAWLHFNEDMPFRYWMDMDYDRKDEIFYIYVQDYVERNFKD